MRTAAVVSVAGAPGVSTLVAATAAATDSATSGDGGAGSGLLVVEAAPAGGVVAARWGWSRTGSVAELAMEVAGTVDLWARARPWLGAARVVTGDPAATVMRQARVGAWLAERLADIDRPVLIDAGRVDGSPDQLALLAAADEVWVLIDPTVAHVTAAKALSGWLARTGRVGLLVCEQTVGPGRYPAGETAVTLGWPLLATVPVDRRAAQALCGLVPARRELRHAPLVRTARHLTARLATEVAA